ncbi:MAG: hypothetical protein BMS9Abin29_0169 [Gemmatimonadota bacterium]|nr:MAG: hypothetical protein BMS9Abin29_0169 [Gemmatimonadota bacterium]
MRNVVSILVMSVVFAVAGPASGQQTVDEDYTAKIREFTTEPFFLTPLVDHLPAAAAVPTPADILGHIAGAADVLSYPDEIYTYMRAVADASPRVKVFSIGETEEGREMILVVVSDEETIAELDGHKTTMARLSDPRITEAAAEEFGFVAYGADFPDVSTHPLATPRVAVVHTCQNTQTEGWLRLGMDKYGVPYDYISVHDVRDDPNLIESYDVLIFGPSSADALSVVRGVTGDEPISWKASELTPNIGRQASTDDMRGGLELEGVLNLKRFVEQGGTYVAIGNSSSVPVYFGLAQGISIQSTPDMWARGGVFRTTMGDAQSPIGYGYGIELGVYFNHAPVFGSGGGAGVDAFRWPTPGRWWTSRSGTATSSCSASTPSGADRRSGRTRSFSTCSCTTIAWTRARRP